MRKLTLAVIGLYIGILGAFSQSSTDSSVYKNRKLKIEEVNFVTSYYHQDGNHSPVTGGIGSEKLSDFATTIELKLNKYDKKMLKHDLSFELGVDHYTSASSDKIDPQTISSASSADTRIYPSASYTITNEQKGNAIGFNASFSNEFDYRSFGSGINFLKTSKDQNREFSIKLQAYLDNLKVILPVELRTGINGRDQKNYPTAGRDSYSSSMSYSQVVSKHLQFALLFNLFIKLVIWEHPFTGYILITEPRAMKACHHRGLNCRPVSG